MQAPGPWPFCSEKPNLQRLPRFRSEKQERLEAIRSKLGAQKMAQLDDEDERIRRAVEEAEAKHAQDEQERAAKTKKAFEEMEQHRLFMVSD